MEVGVLKVEDLLEVMEPLEMVGLDLHQHMGSIVCI